MFRTILDDTKHTLVLGPTGTGKSKFIEGLVRHLCLREDEPTIIVLDPGGSTAAALEDYVAKVDLASRLITLDPDTEQHYLGYNPLRRTDALPLSLQARYVAEAVLTALELDQEDSVFYMPLLEQALFEIARLCIETGFTFHEVPYLLATEPTAEADAIIAQSQEPTVRQFWNGMQSLNPKQRQQQLGLVQARLLPFVTCDLIKNMTAQRTKALDFPTMIERGSVFLADTSSYGTLTPLDSKILSNLIISDVVKACFARPPHTGKPVYLVIEEAGEGLVGTEIGKMLRRARKHGLHVILVNQDVSSLREQNPTVFHQIWSNTDTKIAFGDLPNTDLDLIAEELFLGEFDTHTLKDQIERTFFEPVESTRTVSSYSSGHSTSSSRGRGAAAGNGWSVADMYTEQGLFPMPDPDPLRHMEGESGSDMESSYVVESEGTSEGYSQSEVPFYEFKERREVASRTYYTLEELLLFAKQQLKALPGRRICVKKRGRAPTTLTVPFIDDVPRLEQYHQKTREHVFKQSGCYATIEEIRAEIDHRMATIRAAINFDNPTQF